MCTRISTSFPNIGTMSNWVYKKNRRWRKRTMRWPVVVCLSLANSIDSVFNRHWILLDYYYILKNVFSIENLTPIPGFNVFICFAFFFCFCFCTTMCMFNHTQWSIDESEPLNGSFLLFGFCCYLLCVGIHVVCEYICITLWNTF